MRPANVDDDQAEIVADADGAVVTIERAREPCRLRLGGSFWLNGEDWGMHRDDRDREHRRTVAGNRTPAQIARMIVDRLLPAYRVELAEVRRRRLATLAAREREEQLARELVAVADGRLYAGAVKGRVADSYGVRLELDDLAPETARRVLELIREARSR